MPAPRLPRRLRLAPEWGCWPLWDDETGDNLELDQLPLPPVLIARIAAWDETFQATLDQEYPPDSRFPTEAAEHAYLIERDAIAGALEALLGLGRLVVRR